ncbi:MAG: hypothetical protein K0Q79_1510 [Flavipsychrobacter sp.]|nr:hypothetical protein [Flavipsychrobacter sp.]
MAFQKIDKKFVLSDSSLNVYGMRLLTSGYLLDEFAKNPIGYYGHDPEDGVLVRWDDVQLDGDTIVGWPAINLDHPRGQRTVNELLDGFLNSASVGKLCILEYHLEDNADDPQHPIVVVTKWFNKECSLVDNPGNRNAMKVELFDHEENAINLEDLTSVYKVQVEQPSLMMLVTHEVLSLLSLGDGATSDAVIAGIRNLHGDNARLSAAVLKAEGELSTVREHTAAEKIKHILDQGLNDGKFNKATRDKLELQFAGKPDELADVVNTMSSYTSIVDKLRDDRTELYLADKSWDELDQGGYFPTLKENAPTLYNQKLEEMKTKQKRMKV